MAEAVRLDEIERFRASALLSRMLRADSVRREFRFNAALPAARFTADPVLAARLAADGTDVIVQGVVDCLFDEGEGLVIVDFKSDNVTDFTQPAAVRRYAPQLAAYAKAMERIFKRPVVLKK